MYSKETWALHRATKNIFWADTGDSPNHNLSMVSLLWNPKQIEELYHSLRRVLTPGKGQVQIGITQECPALSVDKSHSTGQTFHQPFAIQEKLGGRKVTLRSTLLCSLRSPTSQLWAYQMFLSSKTADLCKEMVALKTNFSLWVCKMSNLEFRSHLWHFLSCATFASPEATFAAGFVNQADSV